MNFYILSRVLVFVVPPLFSISMTQVHYILALGSEQGVNILFIYLLLGYITHGMVVFIK